MGSPLWKSREESRMGRERGWLRGHLQKPCLPQGEGLEELPWVGARSLATVFTYQLVLGYRLPQGKVCPQAALCFSAKAISEANWQLRSTFQQQWQRRSQKLGSKSFLPKGGSGRHTTGPTAGGFHPETPGFSKTPQTGFLSHHLLHAQRCSAIFDKVCSLSNLAAEKWPELLSLSSAAYRYFPSTKHFPCNQPAILSPREASEPKQFPQPAL